MAKKLGLTVLKMKSLALVGLVRLGRVGGLRVGVRVRVGLGLEDILKGERSDDRCRGKGVSEEKIVLEGRVEVSEEKIVLGGRVEVSEEKIVLGGRVGVSEEKIVLGGRVGVLENTVISVMGMRQGRFRFLAMTRIVCWTTRAGIPNG
jgi:hypothetical protein